ncbi:leukocyte tyrosine kinase receptor [Mustela putorius furo]|uniref:Leukocyte tyrosine kinase receptor n=1 Tax=Mustela putorius furo TaxID=9669 RepID=A0A8U0NU18_MUSPF|nr:leukocyte tyrosine kinase receptor [Mustela putorius furo]
MSTTGLQKGEQREDHGLRARFRRISAYLPAGAEGAENHLSPAHGVFVSAVFSLGRGEPLYILAGQQGEDACPGESPESQLVCLGESWVAEEHAATEGAAGVSGSRRWAQGGRGGGGGGVRAALSMVSFRPQQSALGPGLEAAGGGERAHLRRGDRGRLQVSPEKLENRSAAPGSSEKGSAAGGDASESDILWVDGEDGLSLIHPCSEPYL